MAKRGRPRKARVSAETPSAAKVEEQKPSISDLPTDDGDEYSTVSPSGSPEPRYIAAHNIRSNRGDFNPGDELPEGLLGIETLVEVGAAKVAT
jgi:hypothetical protein